VDIAALLRGLELEAQKSLVHILFTIRDDGVPSHRSGTAEKLVGFVSTLFAKYNKGNDAEALPIIATSLSEMLEIKSDEEYMVFVSHFYFDLVDMVALQDSKMISLVQKHLARIGRIKGLTK
jgi:hypothetical protein